MGRSSLAAPIATKSERDWEAEEDHRTLSRASEIQADPKRMKRCAAVHRVEGAKHKRMGRLFGKRSGR